MSQSDHAASALDRSTRDLRAEIAGAVARAERSQARLNAFSAIDAAGAAESAASLQDDARRGVGPGPLFGVTVAVKDILDVKGLPTRWGSRLLADAAPASADATAVARIRAAGAVIVGKTTTTEFAHSMMGRSPLTGLTVNPWNPDLTTGGSSAGAGVAVAAGLVDLAVATDAGASTRLPAACAGVLGLKPTLGRIPHDGVPEGFANFIHIGLMTRTVAELAAALDVASGPSLLDPHSLGVPPSHTVAALAGRSLAGLRVICVLRAGNKRLAAEVEDFTRRTADRLAALGAEVTFLDPELDNPEPAWRVLQQSNWAARFGTRVAEIEGQIDASFATGIREGAAYSGQQLQAALVKRTDFFRRIQRLFAAADLILTPVVSRGPLPAGHDPLQPIAVDGEVVGDMRREWTPYLSLFDLTGHPALSLPAGFSRDGAPLGVQLVAPWYREDVLLRAAAAFEAAHPWPLTAPDPDMNPTPRSLGAASTPERT